MDAILARFVATMPLWLGASATIAAGVVVAVGWTMTWGGLRCIREWLLDEPLREEVLQKVRVGLGLHERSGSEADECLNSFIAGLDQWRTLQARQRRIVRGVAWSRPLAVALLASAGATWATRKFLENDTLAAWCALVLVLSFVGCLFLLGPVLWLLVERGKPPARYIARASSQTDAPTTNGARNNGTSAQR